MKAAKLLARAQEIHQQARDGCKFDYPLPWEKIPPENKSYFISRVYEEIEAEAKLTLVRQKAAEIANRELDDFTSWDTLDPALQYYYLTRARDIS